jgi:SAM-dependent methyltransferase
MTRLLYGRPLVVATDVEQPYIDTLRNKFRRRPGVEVEHLDLNDDRCLELAHYDFDSVVCLNVLEHVEDDEGALRRLHTLCGEGGTVAIYVPAGPSLFGTMDKVVGHYRRYTREELQAKMELAGFVVEKIFYQNSFGRLGWWWNGRVLRSAEMPGMQSKIFDRMVPLIRAIESTPPSRGLSLIALARRPGARKERSTSEADVHVTA